MGAEGAIVASDPRRARVFRVAMTTRGPRVGVAATRGVSANDPRPPASSANAARACLEHLCECLRALGVGTAGASRDPTALTAETLRRAKFDQPSSVAPLWRALHDLFLVAHAGFPEPSVAAETLRVLRDETADRFHSDEKSDLDDQDAFLDDANEKEHARVARRFLRLAKYPRMHELLHRDEHDRDDGDSSRALLVALAWATCVLDVHARAHADRNAAAFGMFLTNDENVETLDDEKGAFSKGIQGGSSSLLPPYGSDAAARPASAELNAASAVAAERAFLRDAAERARKKNIRRGAKYTPVSSASSSSSAFVEKQAACLAQRVWQSVSHVHALERARAARRIAVHDAQTSTTDGRGASPRRAMTATEIRLAKDKDARGRCMAAMRAVLVTKDAALETVALAETFWAWMRSVLELDEKEKTARAKDAKDAKKKKAEETKRSSSSRRADVTDDTSHDDTSNDSLEHLSSRLRDLELAARRVGPNLRSRRRDVETVARTWRRTREATRADLKQSAALSSLATAAAARTPSIASFEAGARAKMKEDGDACVERDTSKKVKTTRVMTSSSFGIGCSVVDDAPAPPGVAAALATRGGLVAANASNVDDVDELDTANAATGFVEKTNDGETNVAEPRFGSCLLASKRSVANAETCAEAAARLRVTLTESEALLHTQRARAADALRREVTRAFGNENGDGDATRARVAVHGW